MKQLLTPEAVAERLAVSVKTVKNLLRSGKLRGVKVGNLWRLQEEALEEYLKDSTHYDKPLTPKETIASEQAWQDSVTSRDQEEPPGQARRGIKTKEKRRSEAAEHKPRTPLGQRLWKIRSRIIASGEPLLGWEEVEREVAERRGEAE